LNFAVSTIWQYEVAYLLAAVAVIVALVAGLERFLVLSQQRRSLWQACALTVLGFTLLQLSGAGHDLGAVVWRSVRGSKATPVAGTRNVTVPAASERTQPLIAFNAKLVRSIDQPFITPGGYQSPGPRDTASSVAAPLRWFALLWAMGSLALMLRFVFKRLVFVWFSFRGRPVDAPALLGQVRHLSQQLGIRSPVRVIEFPRLQAPIAFGLIRPTIGVPLGFWSTFAAAEREVVLAHELMHIAARDGFWYAMVDILVALLWCHPASWYLRAGLRHASEVAADEASLLVEGGPAVLADCLVRIGEQIRRPRPFAPMSVSGFRSGLGRRVEVLLNLKGKSWSGRRLSLAKLVLPAALLPLLVICSAFTFDHRSMKGATMNGPNWKRSLPIMTLLALINSDTDIAAAEQSTKATPATPASATAARPENRGLQGKQWSGTTKIREKLGRIVLDQVQYDGLPLAEVIRQLIEESRRRDPEKLGVNFLIVNTAPFSAIDSATGLPITSESVDTGTTTIRIEPPLNNVRLIDALDAIVKVADRPLRYVIQDYGVVFSPDPTPGHTEQLVTETFQIQADIFFRGIEAAFGIDVPADTLRAEGTPRSALLQLSKLKVKQAEEELQEVKRRADTGVASSTELRRAEHAVENARLQLAAKEEGMESRSVTLLPNRETQQQIFRELFAQLGVRLEPPKSAFFNELTGIMMVRVTQAEMEAVRPAIETLGGTPTSKLGVTRAGLPGQ
jgi:beta-lactamase regulating signal transducer with metallopeptidase domain